MEYPKFKVCVRCFTYNQSKYITDALNGFCMQETNFPFVCCVVDDASTDGEQEVINKYVEQHFNLEDTAVAYKKETDYAYITYAQHKTNKNCYFAVLLLKRNYYSTGEGEKKMEYISEWRDNVEYEALCEGDDWWIESKKLQMQVDFMDKNPEYGLCHTNYKYGKGKHPGRPDILPNDDYSKGRLFSVSHNIATLTTLIRMSTYKKIPKLWIGKNWLMTDSCLWIELSQISKIKYLSNVTAYYRVLTESASHGDIKKEIKFRNSGVQISQFYANYYGFFLPDDRCGINYYSNIIRRACKLNEKEIACQYYKEAKEKDKLCFRSRLFYYATKYPILKSLIELISRKEI